MHLVKKENKTRTAVVLPVIKHKLLFLDDFVDLRLNEAISLVKSMQQEVVLSKVISIARLNIATFFGKGIVEQLKNDFYENNVELLVVDGDLSPVQQRSLEKALQIKVIDRTAVILEIFGQRAQTKEGKLQVELAHLIYQRSRLVRSWTHLERQRGGGGFLGGPGETQIELDRRLIDNRILKIKRDLEKVKRTRAIHRVARNRAPYPMVALVGYTNVGKSTLFNYITKAHVFAQDMLFATLDPTIRQVDLGKGDNVLFSDTVGFISNLPHELIMAFRATLEEVLEADIILHIIDISNPRYTEYRDEVLKVLHELGLEKIETTSRYIEVYNKVDLVDKEMLKHALELKHNKSIMVSSLTGSGINKLLEKIKFYFMKNETINDMIIPISDGKKISDVYRSYKVIHRFEDDENVYLRVRVKNPT